MVESEKYSAAFMLMMGGAVQRCGHFTKRTLWFYHMLSHTLVLFPPTSPEQVGLESMF